MPQYNFEHKWAHKNTDLSHVSLDILFTLYIRNVHHARTQQHHVYVFGAQGRIQKNALFQCRCPHRILYYYPSLRFLLRKVKRMDSGNPLTHVGAGNALSHLACRKDFEKHLRHKSSLDFFEINVEKISNFR